MNNKKLIQLLNKTMEDLKAMEDLNSFNIKDYDFLKGSYLYMDIQAVNNAINEYNNKPNKTNKKLVYENIADLIVMIKLHLADLQESERLKVKKVVEQAEQKKLLDSIFKVEPTEKKEVVKKLSKKEKNAKKLLNMIEQFIQAGGQKKYFKGLDTKKLSNKDINRYIKDLYKLNSNTVNIKFIF